MFVFTLFLGLEEALSLSVFQDKDDFVILKSCQKLQNIVGVKANLQ